MPVLPASFVVLGLLLLVVALARPGFVPPLPPLGWAALALGGAFLAVVGVDTWRHRLAAVKLAQPSAPLRLGGTGPMALGGTGPLPPKGE